MQWGQRYSYVRPARPKARSLKAEEAGQISARLKSAIDRSPILRAFGVQVRSLRGRFYLEWRWDPVDRPETISSYGRITPLEKPPGELLLEAPYGGDQWSRVGTGSPEKLIKLVAGDTKGTFHGLGALDKSLQATKAGLERLPVDQRERGKFVYAETGKKCSVQETLYHFFGLPIHVIAQPSGWYSYHRTPEIEEFSEDRTRVLVSFTAMSWSGENFGGTCLYLKREERWGAYTIRPNQSQNIATAEAWLTKRNWKSWG
ncbi:hypothetical protein SBV1_90021 [Verrucomicrobia bacterium]|nr:hypothetical protein SBV1_90021 [Verrucomicrobiota bacterium]